MEKKTFKVVTRESQLALWQTNYVITCLKDIHPDLTFEIVRMKTKGDRILNQSLSAIGDKGLFTLELEQAMLAREVDFAVHSLKDMPTELPAGLWLSAVTERQDHRDAFLSKTGKAIQDLPEKAVVGTSSLRRRSQLLHLRPDLDVQDLRGNVNTRLRKFHEGSYDAIILAAAGLDRIDLAGEITSRLETDEFLSAVGQGAIVIECRSDDADTNALLATINHTPTQIATDAERAFLNTLEGGCQVPMGAYAHLEGEEILLEGFVGSLDGAQMVRGKIRRPKAEYIEAGTQLAEELRIKGADDILQSVRS